MKKIRPMGQITGDMELLLQEMTNEHALQFGEVIALVYAWLEIHAPHAKEVYVKDGSSPVLTYKAYGK